MFWPRVLSQTIPDCIRYIIGVFAITLNHRQTFLLHSNTLACVKAEIDSPYSGIHTSQKLYRITQA